MEPVIIHARVEDEGDVIAILAALVDIAIGLRDCEMVAYIQAARCLLAKRAEQRRPALH